MKRISIISFGICVLTMLTTPSATAGGNIPKPTEVKLRVGTFDSRLVAVAYARSDAFRDHLAELQAELAQAKAKGAVQRVKELEAQGPALQRLIHKQGFSTWPIDNILATIEKKIPALAREARVDLIVSKWDLVYQDPTAGFVDVTPALVVLFNPDEETRKVLKSLGEKDPVPLENLSKPK